MVGRRGWVGARCRWACWGGARLRAALLPSSIAWLAAGRRAYLARVHAGGACTLVVRARVPVPVARRGAVSPACAPLRRVGGVVGRVGIPVERAGGCDRPVGGREWSSRGRAYWGSARVGVLGVLVVRRATLGGLARRPGVMQSRRARS